MQTLIQMFKQIFNTKCPDLLTGMLVLTVTDRWQPVKLLVGTNFSDLQHYNFVL